MQQTSCYLNAYQSYRICHCKANNAHKNTVEAMNYISNPIAKWGKSHTMAENEIIPCIKDAIQCKLRDERYSSFEQYNILKNSKYA